MKQTLRWTLVALLGLLAACAVPLSVPTVTLEFGAISARTVQAPRDSVARYVGVFTPDGGTAQTVDPLVSGQTITLTPGVWTFRVEGRNAAGTAVWAGTTTATINAGSNAVSVPLTVVAAGTGSFHLTFDGVSTIYGDLLGFALYPWPAADPTNPADESDYQNLDQATDGTALPEGTAGLLTNGTYGLDKSAGTASLAGTLPAGTYLLHASLTQSVSSSFSWVTEIIEIADGSQTTAQLTFKP